MRQILEAATENIQFYHARNEQYERPDGVPFEVAPTPLPLAREHEATLERVGREGAAFLQAVDELYRTDETAAELLNRGKPAELQAAPETNYLFFRPDLLLGANGLKICEIETSPFGLGLSHLLTTTYHEAGFETVAEPSHLTDHVAEHTPAQGTIVWNDKTASYRGQLAYLADKVFTAGSLERLWSVRHASEADEVTGPVYRAFYLHSYLGDSAVRRLAQARPCEEFIPSLTPHMEEKALMAFAWDKRFESPLRRALGNAGLEFMRQVIPPTWIVGEEAHFAPGLPDNVTTSVDLASLSRSRRSFVLKKSGFAANSSWAEGVVLLQSKSGKQAREALQAASETRDGLFIVQEFTDGIKLPLEYEVAGGALKTMMGRVRLTPYYAADSGQLLTMKATMREHTHFIHASSDSINAPVMWADTAQISLSETA